MAKMKVKLPDELIRRMNEAGAQIDNIAEEGLKAGAQELAAAADARLGMALAFPRIYPKRGTGELRSSLGASPMKILKNGVYDVKVGFGEPRKVQPTRIGRSRKGGGYYTATNAMVGNILEHGHKGSMGGQLPAPWWQPALRDGRQEAEETIRKTVEGRLDEIFNKE